ncbi:MAG: hypothetical protein ACOC3X_02810 [Nanoarchaeota archaeon]
MKYDKLKYAGVSGLLSLTFLFGFYSGKKYQAKYVNENFIEEKVYLNDENLIENPNKYKNEISDLCIIGLKEFPEEIYSKLVKTGRQTLYDYYLDFKNNRK